MRSLLSLLLLVTATSVAFADLKQDLRRHVEALSGEIGSRTPFEPESLERAGSYVASELEAAGYDVSAQPYTFRGTQVANLIATRRGQELDSFYVVGAHYDTIRGTPGADDNASGVAVLIELARRIALRPSALPIRFVAFTLEEPPAFMTELQGSRVFVDRLAGPRVLGALVLEMVGFTGPRQTYPFVLRWAGYPDRGDFIGIIGDWQSRDFGETVLNGFRRNPKLPVESIFVPFKGRILPETRWSDHASFWDRDIPAVMITDTAFLRNPHYHTPGDRADTLDYAFMAELVASLAHALAELAAGTHADQ